MSNPLGLTVISDIHVSAWTTFSDIGPDGRPSRLLQYLTLAEDIHAQAEGHGSDAIVLAGDIVESSLLRPMVLDVLGEFIDILSDFPLYMIHGQHDLDAKKVEISPFHSVLSHLKNRENIYYADRPTWYKIRDYTMLMCPWGHDHEGLHDADVFVGHGFVQGSTNSEGHIFRSGFDRETLWKKFPLSIIGDVHNSQVFESNGRVIIVPGSILQNSHKDAPVTGLWNVELDENRRVSREFTSIHDIRPNFYHKFLFTDDPNKVSTSLIHYRYKPIKEKSERDKTEIRASFQDVNLFSLSSEIITQAKIENKDMTREMLSAAIAGLKNTDRNIPRSKIHYVRIHNFMSIGDFSLELDEFSDNLVIVGPNGSGKTSLFEAIYWCLCNKTTSGVASNDVINYYAADGTTWVELALEIGNSHYKILRQRGPDGPALEIQVWNPQTEKFVEQDRSTTSRTQETIYQLLGLNSSEILLLSYFSAKEPVLFGALGASDKQSLMATISGSSEVDTLRGCFADRTSAIEKVIISTESNINTLRNNIDYLKGEIRKFLSNEVSDAGSEINELTKLKQELESSKIVFNKTEQEAEKSLAFISNILTEMNNASNNLEYERNLLRDQRTRILDSIAGLRAQIMTALEGTCPTCGQSLHDETVLNRLTKEIEEMKSRVPSDEDILQKSNRLVEENCKIQNTIIEKTRLENELKYIRNVNRRLRDTRDRIQELQQDRPDYAAAIKAHQQTIERNTAEISGAEAALSAAQQEYACSKWIYGTLLKRNGPLIQALNSRTRELLQEQIDLLIKGEIFSIRIEDDLSVSASFLERGFIGYKRLSMGQGRIVDIVLMLALSNLFSKLYALEEGVLGVVIFDEVMSFLDENYIDFAYNALQYLNVGKRIVVTHDPDLVSKFDARINVSLNGKGNSTYVKSWN